MNYDKKRNHKRDKRRLKAEIKTLNERAAQGDTAAIEALRFMNDVLSTGRPLKSFIIPNPD